MKRVWNYSYFVSGGVGTFSVFYYIIVWVAEKKVLKEKDK